MMLNRKKVTVKRVGGITTVVILQCKKFKIDSILMFMIG